MKHCDPIKTLADSGCELLRRGAKHDIYHNPKTGKSQPVSRHEEINELLAKKIIRDPTSAD